MEVAIQSKDAVIDEIQKNLNKQIELTRNLQSGLQRIELENTRIKDQIDEINILEKLTNGIQTKISETHRNFQRISTKQAETEETSNHAAQDIIYYNIIYQNVMVSWHRCSSDFV